MGSTGVALLGLQIDPEMNFLQVLLFPPAFPKTWIEQANAEM